MKRSLFLIAGLCVALLATTWAQARVVNLVFDPNDVIDNYATTPGSIMNPSTFKAYQVDARRIHQQWATTFYETFRNPAAPHPQPSDYNTYLNWRDGLTGANEGIAMFNTWFLDDPFARSWGEVVVIRPESEVLATTPDGWNIRFIEDPYGLGGTAIQWWTTDPTRYIRRGGADLGPIILKLDLFFDENANGWDPTDPDVELGESIRFWLGNVNGDDAPFYRDDTQAIYFDNLGWGTRTGGATPFGANYSDSGAGDYGSGFEVAMETQATILVPAPAALGLCAFGIAGVITLRRSLKRKA